MTEGKGHSTWFPGARPPAGTAALPVPQPQPADPEQATYRDTEPRHVLVARGTGNEGYVPGLLLEWRKSRGQLWEARVVYADLRDDRWVTVEEWVRSTLLKPLAADDAAP